MLSALTNIEDLQSSTCSFDRGNSLSYISVSLKFASRSPLGDHLSLKIPFEEPLIILLSEKVLVLSFVLFEITQAVLKLLIDQNEDFLINFLRRP